MTDFERGQKGALIPADHRAMVAKGCKISTDDGVNAYLVEAVLTNKTYQMPRKWRKLPVPPRSLDLLQQRARELITELGFDPAETIRAPLDSEDGSSATDERLGYLLSIYLAIASIDPRLELQLGQLITASMSLTAQVDDKHPYGRIYGNIWLLQMRNDPTVLDNHQLWLLTNDRFIYANENDVLLALTILADRGDREATLALQGFLSDENVLLHRIVARHSIEQNRPQDWVLQHYHANEEHKGRVNDGLIEGLTILADQVNGESFCAVVNELLPYLKDIDVSVVVRIVSIAYQHNLSIPAQLVVRAESKIFLMLRDPRSQRQSNLECSHLVRKWAAEGKMLSGDVNYLMDLVASANEPINPWSTIGSALTGLESMLFTPDGAISSLDSNKDYTSLQDIAIRWIANLLIYSQADADTIFGLITQSSIPGLNLNSEFGLSHILFSLTEWEKSSLLNNPEFSRLVKLLVDSGIVFLVWGDELEWTPQIMTEKTDSSASGNYPVGSTGTERVLYAGALGEATTLVEGIVQTNTISTVNQLVESWNLRDELQMEVRALLAALHSRTDAEQWQRVTGAIHSRLKIYGESEIPHIAEEDILAFIRLQLVQNEMNSQVSALKDNKDFTTICANDQIFGLGKLFNQRLLLLQRIVIANYNKKLPIQLTFDI